MNTDAATEYGLCLDDLSTGASDALGAPEAPMSGSLPIDADFDPPPHLTGAERAVAALLLAGESNAAIAQMRRSATRTVANQVASIYRKLGVGSRAQLAAHEGSRFLRSHGNEHAREREQAMDSAVVLAHDEPPFSRREREVVAFASLGLANKFIAYELGISETSVSTALRSVASKLGARTRVELVGMLASGQRS